jgi:hypothetical protein
MFHICHTFSTAEENGGGSAGKFGLKSGARFISSCAFIGLISWSFPE